MMAAKPKVLAHVVDAYKSAVIRDPVLARGATLVDPVEFETRLFLSLDEFRAKGVRGVWLRVPIELAELVPVAVRCGFAFHSARPQHVTLTAWLPKDSASKLPPAPYHFAGVGAFVLNSRDEILMVREKTGPSSMMRDFWKLPGGLVDQAEDFHAASERELREETGLHAEFLRIAAIQEVHHSEERGGYARGGTTDFYAVCVLRAKNESQPLVPQPDEIAEVRWFPAQEVLAMPLYSAEGSVFSRMFHHAYDVACGRAPGLEAVRLPMGFVDVKNNLFFVRKPGEPAPPPPPPTKSKM